jgi:hypothetical protein
MYEYNHISAMSEASKRSQIYSYIIQRESVFRNYLSSSNVFEINIISLTPSQDSIKQQQSALVTNLIDSLHTLNELCHNKFGCRIFKNQSKTLNDLRKSVDDESSFVMLLARMASIIDSVYEDDMKKQLRKSMLPDSINLIEVFLDSKNINYDKSSVVTLRELHRLRSKMHPIHNAEQEAILLLSKFGISYPIRRWAEEGRICLQEFVTSICKLVTDLS